MGGVRSPGEKPVHKQAGAIDASLLGNASFYGRGMERLGSLSDVLSLDDGGMPKHQSVMLFLPNERINEPVFIGGSDHGSGMNEYRKMLTEAGLKDRKGQEDLMRECAVDLVVRPRRGKADMCVRPTTIFRMEWPEIVGDTVGLLKSLGLGDDRIKILDFSRQMVGHAIRMGEMGRLYPLPRTLVEREHFIEESRVLLGRSEGNMLRHARVYEGLTGQRQMTASDFERFVEDMIADNPTRMQAVDSLRRIAEQANTVNKFDVLNLEFFMSDPEKFNNPDIRAVVEAMGRKGADEKLDDGDTRALRELARKFTDSVEERFRRYDPEDDEARENLLQKLLGGFGEGIEIPGLKVGYLGRGQWLAGPRITDSHMGFPKDMPLTVRNLCTALQQQFRDIEYIGPYQSIGSGSLREMRIDPKREVYMMVIKRRSSPFPLIFHFRRISGVDDKGMDDIMDTVTAARELRIAIPEHQFITVDSEGGEKRFLMREFDHQANPAEKLRIDSYADPQQVIDREFLLGTQAGLNAVVGRVSHFADGGEAFRFTPSGRSNSVVLLEPDGLFEDVKTPLLGSLGLYASHLARSMMKAHVMGADNEKVGAVRDTFVTQFMSVVSMMRNAYELDPRHYDERFPKDKAVSGKMHGAFKRLVRTDVTDLGKRLGQTASELYERMTALLSGLPEGRDRNEVAMALDQLILVHPEDVKETLRVLSSDDGFIKLDARNRDDRVNIMRLSRSASESGLKLSELNAYIQELKKAHGAYAFAVFEDEVRTRFRGLNLRDKDAKLIDCVFRDQQLLSELKGKGYITD